MRQEKGDVRHGPMAAEEAELVGNRINQQLGGRVRELRLEFRAPGGLARLSPNFLRKQLADALPRLRNEIEVP